jgi:hypothetical protein
MIVPKFLVTPNMAKAGKSTAMLGRDGSKSSQVLKIP